eukprot:m.7597 g.7597  ORF g.7597 m.7597 type:complete len:333 (-) comp2991_c0_seq1:38-1036(-)
MSVYGNTRRGQQGLPEPANDLYEDVEAIQSLMTRAPAVQVMDEHVYYEPQANVIKQAEKPQFKLKMNRQVATHHLQLRGFAPGDFIVRYTQKRGGRYVISHVSQGVVEHALVRMVAGNRLTCDSVHTFGNIDELVGFYQNQPLGGSDCLREYPASLGGAGATQRSNVQAQPLRVTDENLYTNEEPPARPPKTTAQSSALYGAAPVVAQDEAQYAEFQPAQSRGQQAVYEMEEAPGDHEYGAMYTEFRRDGSTSEPPPRPSRKPAPPPPQEELEEEFGFSDEEESAASFAVDNGGWTAEEEYDVGAGQFTGTEPWVLAFRGIDLDDGDSDTEY